MVNPGQHAIIDVYNAPFQKANDVYFLAKLAQEAAIRAGATILDIKLHEFKPQGCSGILLISESHISFHSFPELGFIAFDFYTCGDHEKFELATNWLYSKLIDMSPNTKVTIQKIKRGSMLELD